MRYALIDRFVEVEKGERLRAIKCVTRGEAFMAEREFYPSPLVLESMLQAGGALLRSANGFRRHSVLGKVDRVEFHGRARPGDRIQIDVNAILSRPEGKLCRGEASVEGTTIATAEFMILTMPPELEPPFDKERERTEYERRRALRMPRELEEK